LHLQPGTSLCGINVPILATDFKSIANFIVENSVDLIVIGPEAPLAGGITDFLQLIPDYNNY
jgi:phosphoribosylamine--glycine ligase